MSNFPNGNFSTSEGRHNSQRINNLDFSCLQNAYQILHFSQALKHVENK